MGGHSSPQAAIRYGVWAPAIGPRGSQRVVRWDESAAVQPDPEPSGGSAKHRCRAFREGWPSALAEEQEVVALWRLACVEWCRQRDVAHQREVVGDVAGSAAGVPSAIFIMTAKPLSRTFQWRRDPLQWPLTDTLRRE